VGGEFRGLIEAAFEAAGVERHGNHRVGAGETPAPCTRIIGPSRAMPGAVIFSAARCHAATRRMPIARALDTALEVRRQRGHRSSSGTTARHDARGHHIRRTQAG
jgi:hypothetical protein